MVSKVALVRKLQRFLLYMRWGAIVVLSICFLSLVFLASKVFWDLERQRTAGTDNIQWTLTHAQVEYLTFLSALERHLHSPDGPLAAPADFSEVRRYFDIFYSRIDTFRNAQLFSSLREVPDFAQPLSIITGFVDQTASLMDGPDTVLEREIEAIWRNASQIGVDVRSLPLRGIAFFAAKGDADRAATAATLKRMAILSILLLFGLALASFYLSNINGLTRRQRDELRQANERMNTILSTSLDGVIVSDIDGVVLEFNSAAEDIFGYSVEEAKGCHIGDLIVPPHLRELHKQGMRRMRQNGERRVVGQGRVQLQGMRKNKEVFPLELALKSAHSAGKEIIIAFLRDISDAVAAQEELISARDRALAGERAKADFLAVMSHEIRTPLNGLLGNLSLLSNMSPTRDQRQILQNMDLSGQVLLTHVDSVLDITRFEAGKLSIDREPVDLGELLQGIVDGQSGNAASRGNAITWQWSGPSSPWVAVDHHRLRQVLLNLVGNAIKFSENGKVTIEVEINGAGGDEQSPVYEFRVIDTGVGIDEADHDRVFEDFFKHDASFDRSGDGTGLGLGIARRFTKAMGGEIGVESSLGKGSVFWIRLPLEQVDPAIPKQKMDAFKEWVRGLDVLVVEDNPVNLAVITKMLEIDEHRVTAAMNGYDGLMAANAQRFDAILMDISMPVMDGLTATRKIRAGAGKSANVPIVAVSANVLPQSVHAYREAGMNAFVGKPLSLPNLREALTSLFETGNGSAENTGGKDDLDPLAAMRQDLGEEMFQTFLARFVREADELMERFSRPAFADHDLAGLAEDSHRLASSAAMYGCLEMRDVLVQIEVAAMADEKERVCALAEQAKTIWASACESLPRSFDA